MTRTRTRVVAQRFPDPPVAGFVSDQISGISPLTINITDQSQNATSWSYTCTGSLGTVFTSTAQNPSFALATAETWTIVQTVTNRTGSNTMTRTDYVVTSGLTDFGTVDYLTARADGAGENWVRFGVSAAKGVIISSRKTKLVARYPSGPGGTIYPVQIDHMQSWADGSMQRCTISMKTPPGYTSRSDIEIGYSDTYTPSGVADWASIMAANPASFTGTIAIFSPTIYFLALASLPIVNDTLQLTFTEVVGGFTRSYSRTYETSTQLSEYNRNAGIAPFLDILRDMQFDGTSRWQFFKNPPGKVMPAPAQGSFTNTSDNSFRTNLSFNAFHGGGFGTQLLTGSQQPSDFVMPVPQSGAYVWGRGPDDFTLDFTCTRTGASTFGFTTTKVGNNLTTGSPYKVRTGSPRVNWTWNFNDASKTVAYANGWRNGALIREQIHIVPLRSAGSPHPFLVARAVVSFDAAGNRIDHQVSIENCQTSKYADAVHYDVLDITVNGVNQIAGEVSTEKYKDLYHNIGTKWRWRQAQTFAMCDPVAIMQARFKPGWKRFPTRTFISGYEHKLRGASSNGDYMEVNSSDLTLRGGYEKAGINYPLYQGSWKHSGQGGGCGEIGISNWWSWAFFANDVFAHWPYLEACADNVASAQPWHFIDEVSPDADWVDSPPHLYKRYWMSAQQSRDASPSFKFAFNFNTVDVGAYPIHNSDWTVDYNLYQGYGNNAYGYKWTPVASHAPHSLAYDAWLVTGEEVFHRNCEMFGWAQMTGALGDMRNIKTGGAAFDANHKIMASGANGNRTMAWSWRAKIHAAAVMFDAHPRRAVWRRACQDSADYFGINVSKTVWGTYNVRASQPSSDNWDAPNQLAGDVWDQWVLGHPNYGVARIDAFKSYYVTVTAAACADLELATGLDVSLTANKVWFRIIEETTDWWNFFGISGLPISLTGGGGNPNSVQSPNGVITDNIAAMEADLLAKTNRTYPYDYGLINQIPDYTDPPDFQDLVDGGLFGVKNGCLTYVPNYVVHMFHVNSLQALERHNTVPSEKALITSQIADFRTRFPDTTVRASQGGRTYEQIWTHMNIIQPWETMPRWKGT